MRIKRVVAAITAVLVCIVIIASTLFVSGQQGLVWLSVQSLSGEKFVAVRDKEMRSLLKDSAKEVMHQGKKVNTADYETTYGSVLFLVNWICPVQIKEHIQRERQTKMMMGRGVLLVMAIWFRLAFENLSDK